MSTWKPPKRRRNQLRDEIGGGALDNDRLWRVTGPNFVAGFTEYNGEITGAAPILRRWCWYGAHLRQAINVLRAKGFQIEEVEDRR